MPRDLGSSLSRVLRIRLVADYDSEAVEEVDAEWSISEAETFVAAIGEALPQLGAP